MRSCRVRDCSHGGVMTGKGCSALAVVRCGDASLHQSWSGAGRDFDIGVSYFGDDLTREFPEARYVHRAKGGKWEGLFGFFKKFPATIEQYDYFWLAEDDILSDVDTINALCQIAVDYNLEVCQPSLDTNSFYSYLITLRHSSFLLRYTNFVEIMAPLITRAVLQEMLPMFEHLRIGFGLDFVFPVVASKISGHADRCTAIIDSVSVCHTRPVGGPQHKMIKQAGGPSPLDELRAVVEGLDIPRKSSGYGVAVPRIRVLSGWDRRGKFRHGIGMIPDIIFDLLLKERNKARGVSVVPVVKHALKTIL
jgi:hypothetical protein